MVVRTMSKFELKRICRTIGAVALPRISCPSEEEIGRCKTIFATEISERKLVKIEQYEGEGQVATIVLRASTNAHLDDCERAIDDAVSVYKAAAKNTAFLAGAGACEIALSLHLQAMAESRSGLEQ